MAQKELDHLEIYPGENGGGRVVHEFKPKASKRGGAMSGGIYMDRPEREEHMFGKAEGRPMIRHIASALGLKNEGGQEMHTAEGSEDENGEI
jgi:hypothetical protein